MTRPLFASALSTQSASKLAVSEALDELDARLDGTRPDLVAAFATHHHGPALEDLGPRLARRTGAEVVFGCTAESVIGNGVEAEGQPGLSLWAARLPGTEVRFFESRAAADEDGEPTFSGFPPVGELDRSSLLLVADPYTFPPQPYLRELEERWPGVPVMGGMASGAMGPGQTLLFTADGVREHGCVGAVLEGGVELRPVVSQGCRPVGNPWVITDCERNQIKKLGGKPALEVLTAEWTALPQEDQKRLQGAPFVGLAIDPAKTRFERGDFLVRGLMGLNHHDRSIAVADFVRRGQTIQLLVRDADSAGEDLRQLLEKRGGGGLTSTPAHAAGALLFSCNGRGSRMFDVPDHDVTCVRTGLSGDVPVAGFFASGEIGPVGGRNFVHGFTASVALFRPDADA